jgi:hypothetical protein
MRDAQRSRQHRRVSAAVIGALLAGALLLAFGVNARRSGVITQADDVLAATPPASQPAVDLRPVTYWEKRFLESWDYDRENGLPKSLLPDSWPHYEISYDVDAATAMYRATGQKRYLDRALEYVGNVVSTARQSSSLPTSQYRDRYLGWVSTRPDLDPSGVEVPLYESYFWRYATTLLRVMRQTPAVYTDAAYRQRYDDLLAFAEVHIFEKWHRRGADDNIYRSRTHMVAHWATIALNLSLITDDPDRRARYRTVVDAIDRGLPNEPSSLRGQLRRSTVEPSAYFWSDVWGSERRPGQDVSHGNSVMAYVVEAKDLGGHWTAADMAGFTALLTKVIWPSGRRYAAYVDGTGKDNGWFSDGFVKLGRYDRAAQRRLEDHHVVNAQFAANMALNARTLS